MNYHKPIGADYFVYAPHGTYLESKEILAPGIYAVKDGARWPQPMLPMFFPVKEKDNLISFSEGAVKAVITEMENFLSNGTKEKYTELKICHKTGMILYGPAGTGKSSVAMLAMKMAVEKFGVVCLDFTGQKMQLVIAVTNIVREKQTTPIVVFMDEIDESIVNSEYRWLHFLDGSDSVESCIVIGCTNNMEKIPNRIKERKSRIKETFLVEKLPDAVYKEYLKAKLPKMDPTQIAKFSYHAMEANLSIDQFKHAIMEHHLWGMDILKAVNKVKKFIPAEVEDLG